MQVLELIGPLYSALTLLAAAVVWLYWRPVVQAVRAGDYDTSSCLAIGILFGWSAEGITRAWWAVWRYGLDSGWDVDWMVGNPIVAMCSLLLIGGATLHIRAATHSAHGERIWFLALSCAGLVFLADLFLR